MASVVLLLFLKRQALARSLMTLRVAVTLKGIGSHEELQHAVRIGVFAGQGNALAPVRPVEELSSLLQDDPRLGF